MYDTQKCLGIRIGGTKTLLLSPVFLSLVILSSVVLLSSGMNLQAQPEEKNLQTVRVEAVGVLPTSQPKNYVGLVTAKETVVLVPRISGFLEKVAFQEGSTVKKGDILFEIEDTVYQMNVRVAESVIRQIEAEIELAKKDLERSNTLRPTGAVTEQELNQVQRTITLQEARLDEAKAQLALARNDLSYTKIQAPLTGRIGAKMLSEGNYVTPTTGALATIVQYDPVSVKFSLSETDYMTYFQTNENETKDIHLEIRRSDGQPYQGEFKVDFVDNQVDRETGTITVYLICQNKSSQLLPGGYARISLAEKFKEPLPAVDMASVMTDGNGSGVFVLTPENKVERRNVTLGPLVFDKYVIKSGLSPGERVIVGGINKLTPGMKVRPVLAPAATIQK
ncbi:MAG: efflux RND transporter periplasmic adaptor subunit [Planctomycetaceae bacterium]|nr:efflux RND transporter periplasmic adaptor subunit [Planctomycetaceae bacterium]